MLKKQYILFALMVVFALLLAQCTPAPAAPAEKPAEGKPAASAKEIKLAAIFPGVITDADYNSLGYLGVEALQKDMGVQTAYSEKVAVPDVERVMREYADQGFNVIWTHGSQFLNPTKDLAAKLPDVVFIAEGDANVENPPKNFWFIDRNYHYGYYVLGAIAGKMSKTGKIGYLTGLTMPFTFAELHAAEQALKDLNIKAEIKPAWVGDFNDPTKGRAVTDTMISEDVDFIMCSLNLGAFGVFEGAKAASGKKVYVTAKNTDKSSFAPDNYVATFEYDFRTPMKEIVEKIKNGETGGYYPLSFDKGYTITLPLKNAPAEVSAEIEKILADVKSGKIEVKKDVTPVQQAATPTPAK